MKSRPYPSWSVCLLVALAFALLASCGKGGGFRFPWAKRPVVGLSFSDFAAERWVRANDRMTKLLEKAGCEVVVREANNNAMLQNDHILDLTKQGAKAIVIVAENGYAAIEAVEAASKAGVKVIAHVRPVFSPEVATLVTCNFIEVGREQARGVLKRAPKGEFVLLGGSPTDANAVRIRAGQMEILKPLVDSGDVSIVGDQWVENWDASNAWRLMKNVIAATSGDINAVLASNDGTALAAIAAMRPWGLAGKVPVSGFDATVDGCASIQEGELSFSVLVDEGLFDARAVEVALALIKGKKMKGLESHAFAELYFNDSIEGSVACSFIPLKCVDAANLEKAIVEAGIHAREDIEAAVVSLRDRNYDDGGYFEDPEAQSGEGPYPEDDEESYGDEGMEFDGGPGSEGYDGPGYEEYDGPMDLGPQAEDASPDIDGGPQETEEANG